MIPEIYIPLVWGSDEPYWHLVQASLHTKQGLKKEILKRVEEVVLGLKPTPNGPYSPSVDIRDLSSMEILKERPRLPFFFFYYSADPEDSTLLKFEIVYNMWGDEDSCRKDSITFPADSLQKYILAKCMLLGYSVLGQFICELNGYLQQAEEDRKKQSKRGVVNG